MDKFKEILKKGFGKNKDKTIHARIMLAIYMFFFIILVLFIRLAPAKPVEDDKTKKDTNNTNTVEPTNSPEPTSNTKPISNEINYSYTYTIVFDNNTEKYIGKRIDDKEKFSLLKNGEYIDYAIVDGVYLKSDGNLYSITDSFESYFRYCDTDKILSVVGSYNLKANELNAYTISNDKIEKVFSEQLINNNNGMNNINIKTDTETIRKIDMDLSNYISSLLNESHTLNITMEFANIGTTENFDIKMN